MLPPDTVRLLALRLRAFRAVVSDWRYEQEALTDLEALDVAPEDVEDWNDRVTRVEMSLADANHLSALAADMFLGAADNLLPPEVLGL